MQRPVSSDVDVFGQVAGGGSVARDLRLLRGCSMWDFCEKCGEWEFIDLSSGLCDDCDDGE